MIVLHDPHAEVQRSGCISALKILTAARAILDLIYNVWSTSFDITLLDTFCSVIISIAPCIFFANLSSIQFCWFSAGRVLVRFLQVALEAKSMDQVSTLRAEVDFVQSVIYLFWRCINKVSFPELQLQNLVNVSPWPSVLLGCLKTSYSNDADQELIMI
jgi:hypothetical protein